MDEESDFSNVAERSTTQKATLNLFEDIPEPKKTINKDLFNSFSGQGAQHSTMTPTF